jgi:hypothetical protein
MPPKPPPDAEQSSKEIYMRATFRGQFYPKNEYEHAKDMVNSEMDEEISTIKHSQLYDDHIQTSNIGNDELMNAVQMDSPFLHSALSMAKRNSGLVAPFNIMFFSWRDGLLITKAKNGQENLAQHATGAKNIPRPFDQGGYGAGLPQYQPEQNKQGFLDKFKSAFGGKK